MRSRPTRRSQRWSEHGTCVYIIVLVYVVPQCPNEATLSVKEDSCKGYGGLVADYEGCLDSCNQPINTLSGSFKTDRLHPTSPLAQYSIPRSPGSPAVCQHRQRRRRPAGRRPGESDLRKPKVFDCGNDAIPTGVTAGTWEEVMS
mgnify:CR=1 FL=1